MCLAVDDIQIGWPDPREMTDEDLQNQAFCLSFYLDYSDSPDSAMRYHYRMGLKEVKAEFNRRRAERKKI